jgi:phospholipase/lecithinase/hemolysin
MTCKTPTLLVAGAALALSMANLSALDSRPYSGIVVFGTSLSDSGNAFALRGGANTPPDYFADPLLIPGEPYARGGHHFSNGATWIEQFARSLGLAGSVQPAFASSSPTATNYAVGSARAYDDGINVNLTDQVNAFLADVGGVAPSDALYVIEMGSSDIRDAIVAYQTGGPGAAQAILHQALESIAANIQTLHRAGAREFLVWIPPNVALTPALRSLAQLNPAVTQLATGLTYAFNSGLKGALAGLAQLPDIRITQLDAYALLNDIVAAPAAYGLVDVTTACLMPNVAPYFCQNPNEYLFWDGIHPSGAAQTIAAYEAARVLAQ